MGGLNYRKARFFSSAETVAQCPEDVSCEVAFIGRSNSGKSSALNVLTGQPKLARISKTPGRTQLINFFIVESGKFLVDLPGYGYACVSKKMKQEWQERLGEYLNYRKELRGVVLLMDIRHPLKESDRTLLEWSQQAGLDTHILLTKVDKLRKSGMAKNVLFNLSEELQCYSTVTVQLFSSKTKLGIVELTQTLDTWLLNTDK